MQQCATPRKRSMRHCGAPQKGTVMLGKNFGTRVLAPFQGPPPAEPSSPYRSLGVRLEQIYARTRQVASPHGGARALAALLLFSLPATPCFGQATPSQAAGVAVGAQYDSTHVYVSPSDLGAFVNSVIATFGGH